MREGYHPEYASFAAFELGIVHSQGLAVVAITLESSLAGRLEEVRKSHRLLHLVTTDYGVHFTFEDSIFGRIGNLPAISLSRRGTINNRP